jgi:DNA-binding transcriptional regulator YdaS (Cro superfamily)
MKRKPLREIKDEGLRAAVEAAGGSMYKLSQKLGITPSSVLAWDRVPLARVLDVEAATGVRRERLRPELYR